MKNKRSNLVLDLFSQIMSKMKENNLGVLSVKENTKRPFIIQDIYDSWGNYHITDIVKVTAIYRVSNGGIILLLENEKFYPKIDVKDKETSSVLHDENWFDLQSDNCPFFYFNDNSIHQSSLLELIETVEESF